MDHVARAEVLIGAPADRVWDVLTSSEPRPEIMFGARTVSAWQPGHRLTWSGPWQGHPFEDKGEVLEVERPHRLVVTHFSPLSGQPDVPESYHRLQYVLDPVASGRPAEPDLFSDLLTSVPDALRRRGEATSAELIALTGRSRSAVLNDLRELTESGSVVAIGLPKSPKRRYRWVGPPSGSLSKETP